MMGLPTLIIVMGVENPGRVSLFMNSNVYSHSLPSVSQLLHFFAYPGNLTVIILFIPSTVSLFDSIIASFIWQEAIEFD